MNDKKYKRYSRSRDRLHYFGIGSVFPRKKLKRYVRLGTVLRELKKRGLYAKFLLAMAAACGHRFEEHPKDRLDSFLEQTFFHHSLGWFVDDVEKWSKPNKFHRIII
jgi:hypothetical protein